MPFHAASTTKSGEAPKVPAKPRSLIQDDPGDLKSYVTQNLYNKIRHYAHKNWVGAGPWLTSTAILLRVIAVCYTVKNHGFSCPAIEGFFSLLRLCRLVCLKGWSASPFIQHIIYILLSRRERCHIVYIRRLARFLLQCFLGHSIFYTGMLC